MIIEKKQINDEEVVIITSDEDVGWVWWHGGRYYSAWTKKDKVEMVEEQIKDTINFYKQI